MDLEMSGSCKNCIYVYASSGDHPRYECRRFPPQLVQASVSNRGEFPQMSGYDYCGEYQDKHKACK